MSRVYVILDVCHMIKLIQNLLGQYKVICHEENSELKQIKWEYIGIYLGVQEEVRFSFSNKLKKKHLLWEKHKMNVKPAVQTLSLSVATAIDFF